MLVASLFSRDSEACTHAGEERGQQINRHFRRSTARSSAGVPSESRLTQLRQQFVKSFFSGVRFRVHWFWHRVQSCKLDVVKTKPFFNPGNLMACICGDVIEPGTASDTRTGRWLNRCVPRGGRGSRLWPIWGRWMRQAGWGWWMRRVAVLSRRRGSCLSCLQPGDGWRWITSGFGWRTAGRLGVTGWGCSWWIGWGSAVSCRG